MGQSPYPARRIPVDRAPALAGAPRERRVKPLDARTAARVVAVEGREAAPQTAPVNSPAGSVWGPGYRGVTSRKALKRPAWSSNIAGGSHIVAPGV